jgi:hypothetical protein
MTVALSQVDYLQSELALIDNKIEELEGKQNLTGKEIKDLYFQKGKLYSELELMRRVPEYE